jgi:predicted Zn-dependent peptidase
MRLTQQLCAALSLLLLTGSVMMGQVDRTRKPEAGPTPSLTLPEIQRSVLPNGMRVMLVEHHELPVVQMNMIVLSGSAHDPREQAGLANLTAQMLDEGTAKRTALQVADDIDFLGASMSFSAGMDASSGTLLTLREHLGTATEIFADVLLHAAFPETEWDRVKKTHLTALLQQQDEPGTVASKVFNQLTFGSSHPFGRPSDGTEASVQSVTVDDLRAFYTAHYRPNNATLLVVGDITMKELEPVINERFSSWESRNLSAVSIPPSTQPERTRIFLVDKPDAAQSEIRIGHVGVRRNTDDYFALTVLNTILGGQFSSRVNMNLRESKGYTYGARTGFTMWKEAGPFIASAAVKTAVTDSSVIEFMKELRRIRDEDVTVEELEFARNSLIRREPQKFETPGQIAGQLAAVVIYDLPDDYFQTYVQKFQSISVADIRRVAGKYLNPSTMNIVIVGDVAAVRDGLEKLGYGQVSLLRSDGNPVQ